MKKYVLLLIPCLILVLFVWNPFHNDTVISQFSADAIAAKENRTVIVLDAGHGGYQLRK